MSKVPFYVKRQNGQNSYNYNHPAYNYPYKKNYFKNKNKQSNNHINNYIEERKKNYYYYENPYSYYSFSQKNNYTQWNNLYYPEEKKIFESVGNNSFHEEMKKDELLRIRVNVSEKQYKELVICKKDDVNKKVIEFCKENFITEKLIEPLLNKVNQSLNTLKIINNNYSLNENDFVILNKLRNIISSNKKK